MNDDATAARFESEANRIRVALREVLWDEETGRWRDLLLSDWDEDDWEEVPLVRFDSQQRVAVGLHEAIIKGLRADPTQVLHNTDFIDELEAMFSDSPDGRLLPEPWAIYLHDLHREMCEKREWHKRKDERTGRKNAGETFTRGGSTKRRWDGRGNSASRTCAPLGKPVTFATNKITGHYNKTAVDLYLGFFDSSLGNESVHTPRWDVWAGDRRERGQGGRRIYPRDGGRWIPLWCGAVARGSRSDPSRRRPANLRTRPLGRHRDIAGAHGAPSGTTPTRGPRSCTRCARDATRLGATRERKLAREVATRWVRGNATALERTGYMHEKYDAMNAEAGAGGGGEYSPQRGFGWSNGVALHFLRRYFAAGPGGSEHRRVGHSESTHSLPDDVMRP